MNDEERSIDAAEPAPQATNKKLDRKTLLLMVVVLGSLIVLVAFNMK